MNWRLLFSGLKSPGWAAYAIFGIVAAILISYWLLRLERKLVSPRVGWTLVTLRGFVLLTLLLTVLQPVLTKQFDLTERGRVVVAIDGSLSMETQDRHASLAEKLRWAQSLGMLGNVDTSDIIDRWVVAAENGDEPNWLGTETQPSNPAEQASADLRKQQIMNSLEELAAMPRVEFVRRLLQSQPQKLLDELEAVMPIDIRFFATEQKSAMRTELAALLQSDREDLVPGSTDLIQLLQSVTAEEDASQLRGIVLISDGRQTVAGDLSGTAQRMASLGVPVFTIPIGSRFPPRDLSIAAVDAPEAVFLNDKAQVKAVVGTSGFEGQPLTIRLEKDGVTVDQQTVTPATDTATITFSVPTDTPGRFGYKLVTEVQQGELREDNNVRDVSLQVVDSKARVMLFEGDARWEFRYLKNLLDRDKQVEPQSVLFRQPYLNLLNESFIASSLPPLDAFAEQLARTDLLIVGDVGPEQVDQGIWELIEKAVTRDGLTLIIVPGRRDMPHSFQSDALTSLLPVTEFRQRLAEQFLPSAADASPTVFKLMLTPEAQALPMFQLSTDPGVRNSTLSELPGHPWIYGGKPKPGATVLANASIAGVNVAPEPTIVHHDYGFGQVLWMGLDSTWRWRMRAGDEWHYKFWGQVIRWAARNKSASGNDDVRMTLSDVIIDQSENVEAVVRWNPKLLTQLQGAIVEAVAIPVDPPAPNTNGREVQGSSAAASAESNAENPARLSAVLQASSEAPERFTGRLPRLPPGVWRIELTITGGTLKLRETVECEVLVREQVSAELADVSCNRELLKELSDVSGGELVEPFDVSRLVQLIQPKDQLEQKIEERTLWDHWLILLIFFALLMSEWVIRKLNGLP
jgi:hypothetical protein